MHPYETCRAQMPCELYQLGAEEAPPRQNQQLSCTDKKCHYTPWDIADDTALFGGKTDDYLPTSDRVVYILHFKKLVPK